MWRIYNEFTSVDRRLRVSLMTPVEEPWNDFLDLRRVFEKDGEVLCTKRGFRIQITSGQLLTMVEVLRDIGQGRKSSCESAGLRFLRRTNALYIRRVSPEEGGDHPVLLVLSPIEAAFLMDKLIILKDIMTAREEMDQLEVDEENEEVEVEHWF